VKKNKKGSFYETQCSSCVSISRLFVVYNLPTLQFLDYRAVSDDERWEAAQRGAFLHVVRPSADQVLQQHQLAAVFSYSLPVLRSDVVATEYKSKMHNMKMRNWKMRFSLVFSASPWSYITLT